MYQVERRGTAKILLSCLLGFLLLLSLQTIHVALQEVAVSKLELVDVFSVYDCGNFLAFKDCSHQTHKLGRHMRLSCWRDFGILHRNLFRTNHCNQTKLTDGLPFFPLTTGLGFGMGLVLPSYLFIQTLQRQILERLGPSFNSGHSLNMTFTS